MPTYDFACKTCDDVVEVVRKFLDSDDVICEKCGSIRNKKFTSPPVMFTEKNGPGKYVK